MHTHVYSTCTHMYTVHAHTCIQYMHTHVHSTCTHAHIHVCSTCTYTAYPLLRLQVALFVSALALRALTLSTRKAFTTSKEPYSVFGRRDIGFRLYMSNRATPKPRPTCIAQVQKTHTVMIPAHSMLTNYIITHTKLINYQ